jgi:sulfur carrier protein ThiS
VELEHREGLTVAELIDMLTQHPADAIVEMSIIAPVTDGDDDITVDRDHIDGVMPWTDEGDDAPIVWLVGGEDDDVDVFLDAIEIETETD